MEAHSSISGRGLRVLKPKEVKKETMRLADDELPINLGLEIGTNSLRNQNFSSRTFHCPGKSVLTMSQLDELRDQFLIHKHLAAGLRVPTHLLVPIWKSSAKTAGSNIHVVRFSPLGFNNGHMMDPEPGRCRRTDGKKWRCSRDTIPHQKYCERHMHRGRNRSRKPVETSEMNSPSKKTFVNNPERNVGCLVAAPATSTSRSDKTTNHLAAAPATSTSSSDKTTNNLAAAPATTASRSDKTTNHLVAALSTTTSRSDKTMNHFTWGFPAAIAFPLITEAIINSPKMVNETITSSTHATSTTAIHTSCVDAAKTITMVPASANNIAAPFTTVPSIKTSCVISLKDVCSMSCGENCSKSRNDFSRNIFNVQKIPSPGFGFSPNSVLQVPGRSSSCNDNKINIELELGRCRRTDGKKWRCRRDIIPNQKYCELHMHRGSKRHLKSSEKRTDLDTSAATFGLTPLPSSMLALPKAEPATLNTNLSMSIQAGDKQKQHEESNVSCSSETTITDTTITA